MKTAALHLLAVLLATATTPVDAAVVLDVAGKATGITDLAVGGSTYDVTFQSGTFTSVFGTASDFTTVTASAAARGAVNAALNAAGTPAPFLAPADPTDNVDAFGNSFYVPYDLSGPAVSSVAAFYLGGIYGTVGGTIAFRPAQTAVWADFTLVPLPGAAVLLVTALAGLGCLARRQGRQA